MPHDRNGQIISAGQRVFLPCKVAEVFQGQEACNAQLQVESNEAAKSEYQPLITLNSRFATIIPQPGALDHAINELEVTLNVAETNAPIQESEGQHEQAKLNRDRAASIRQALGVLKSL
jgi:hypothetical protein